MKLRCNDGIVRNFSIARCDGDYLSDGTRQDGDLEAFCLECGYGFGWHDTYLLKSHFRKHTCRQVDQNDDI